ncbi:unnamed protein product [Ambrosiozyma monospora]|uniref:Unnamed protein product n=1 Tax=Ambrosiozyma monospora TaxID=43982 RepID=A0ACB5T356_AMBMO|nr:unnamed protein product [Ambrosiozyma monospora]
MTSTVALPKIDKGKFITKAITFKNYTTPWKITSLELPVASAESIVKPDEILIKTSAVAVNPIDILVKELTPNLPIIGSSVKIAGLDFSGVVLQIGDKFNNRSGTQLKVGDKVFGGTAGPGGTHNTFSEYIVAPDNVFNVLEKVPESMSMDHAAGINVVTNTAYECFLGMQDKLEGGNVLVLGAGSSVGHMAIQWAKLFGAKNIIVTASPRSSQSASKVGATSWLDYTKGEQNVTKEAREFVKSSGKFDLIVDTVRDTSLHPYLDEVLKTKKEGGKLSIVLGSFSKSHTPHYKDQIPSFRFLRTYVRFLTGFSPFNIDVIASGFNKPFGADFQKLVKSGTFDLKIDSVLDFYTQYQEAYDKVYSDKNVGKVILSLEGSANS